MDLVPTISSYWNRSLLSLEIPRTLAPSAQIGTIDTLTSFTEASKYRMQESVSKLLIAHVDQIPLDLADRTDFLRGQHPLNNCDPNQPASPRAV